MQLQGLRASTKKFPSTPVLFLLGAILLCTPATAIRGQQMQGQPDPKVKATKTSSDSGQALTPTEVFKRASQSVFVIESIDKDGSVLALGSAVAIAPEEVVTNQHVVEKGSLFRVSRGTGHWPARVTHADPEHDLCRLTVTGLDAVPAVIRFPSNPQVGERVYAVGAPKGLELSLSEGLISGVRDLAGVRNIQTTAPISSGSSGGGLFDDHARLVGITSLSVKEGQNLNFAIPSEHLAMLESHPVNARSSASASSDILQTFQAAGRAALKGDEEYETALLAAQQNSDDPDSWIHFASVLRSFFQFDKSREALRNAEELLTSKLHTSAGDENLWYKLGCVRRGLRDHSGADKALREAVRLATDKLRLDPKNATVWQCLADSHVEFGEYDEAIKAYQESIRLQPSAERWARLGEAYFQKPGPFLQRHPEEAVRAFEEAVRLDSSHAEAWSHLCRAYPHQVAPDRPDRSVAACKTAIQLRAKSSQRWADWRSLGDNLMALERFQEAVKAYREGLATAPHRGGFLWDGLGEAYLQTREFDKALKCFEEYLLFGESPSGWRNIGRALILLKKYDRATAAFEEATRRDPRDSNGWFLLGTAHSLNGNRAGTIAAYERLKALDTEKASEFFRKYILP
jgi:cytochrome c-type biogenesis protein CcmH/NrfG